MRFIYDAHEYRYNDDTGRLVNNYGTHVATIEHDDMSDEYYYADIPELDNMSQPGAIHQSVIQDNANARGLWLVQTYVACTS